MFASPYITRWEWRVPPISSPRGYYLRRDRGGTCNVVASSLCHANREHGRPRGDSVKSVLGVSRESCRADSGESLIIVTFIFFVDFKVHKWWI